MMKRKMQWAGLWALIGWVMLAGSWCQAGTPADTLRKVRVSSLDLAKMSWTGHGGEETTKTLSIAGQAYGDGIWMRAHAYLYIDLGGHGRKFTARVGVDDAVKGQEAAVEFIVLGDGRELWKSGLMRVGEPAKTVEVNLAGVKTLVLSALPFSKNYLNNLADWAEAQIETDGAAPQTMQPPQEAPYILTPKAPQSPRINAPRIYGAHPGHPFLFALPVSGERPMSYSAKGLPKGLKLDQHSGIISGVAKKAGHYPVKIAAWNRHGKAEGMLRLVIGDQLALTPPMGWNDWYSYSTLVTGETIRDAAKAMVKSGMSQYGYAYVNIDDCWMVKPGAGYSVLLDEKLYREPQAAQELINAYKLIPGAIDPEYGVARDEQGKVNANPRFPDMKGLTDSIHALGLKAGIYTSPGPLTCAGFVGSLMFEEQDASRFAEWGFDFLKYDWCSYGTVPKSSSLEEMQRPYVRMNKALRKQPRDIVFNLCQYGMGEVWEWGKEVGGHCWRTTGDLGARVNNYSLYSNLVTIGFGQNGLEKWAGPGHWNDPDYLLFGKEFGLSPDEEYSYMSLWCLLSAPLIYSGRMDQLDEFTLNLLCNAEVLAVNQDPLGRQARIVARDSYGYVWAKEMEDGSMAVGLFNVGEYPTRVKIQWKDLGIKAPVRVRDLWRQKDLGVFEDEFAMSVPRHGVGLVRMTAKSAQQGKK